MKKSKWFHILFSIIPVAIVLTLGGIFSSFNREWYEGLNKSILNPPGFIFAIVWNILYAIIAIGLYFALKKGIGKKTVILYIINGILNVLWCLAFFTLQSPQVAFIILLANLVFAIVLAFDLLKISKVSFYTFLPYCIWLFYATILNYLIIMLN